MGKKRYLFRKIGDTKGKYHAQMNTIQDRNGKQEIKKRGQEYTEELYKKVLMTRITVMV